MAKLPGGLLDAHVSGEASDLAGDPLHAVLALDDGVVDVSHSLNKVVHRVDFWMGKKERKRLLEPLQEGIDTSGIVNVSRTKL